MRLTWVSNRTAGTGATRWWADAQHGTYHIEKDPTWRTIYYVHYVGPDGSGRACDTKLGSAYTVPDAKLIAQQHNSGD